VVVVIVVVVGAAVGELLLAPLLFLVLGDCFSAFWSMRFKMSVFRRAGMMTSPPLRMELDAAATTDDDDDDVDENAAHEMTKRANVDGDDFMMMMM